MPVQAQPLLTREDYNILPETNRIQQLIDGQLIVAPSPFSEHQRVIRAVLRVIEKYLEEHPLGEVFIAPLDVHLNETNVYQPDLFFIAKERLAIVQRRGVEGAPDLVVEVLSPATERYDRRVKRKIYAQFGVRELWLLDTRKRAIERWDLQENPEAPSARFSGRGTFQSKVLPGFTLVVEQVFRGV